MTESHRAGWVALLGRPNAGKSTLLNRLLGEKLAIVTAKPQTSRSRLLGIRTLENAQLLLVDTPGLHGGTRALDAAMHEMVERAADDCDVALLILDPRDAWGPDHAALAHRVQARSGAVIPVRTKADLGLSSAPGGPEARCVSAHTGEGLSGLLDAIVSRLPESPPLYPADALSDRPLRFLAAERVREAAFEALSQELPYALAVEVEEFVEAPGRVRIRANLLLERASQKRIAIGRGGAMIREIGTRARREIEKQLGARVHLELWVKLERGWSRRPKRLKSLGYS